MDLKALKKNIDSRKVEIKSQGSLGAPQAPPPVSGDKFLNQLMASANSGMVSEATQKIKAVDQKVKINDGETVAASVQQQPVQQQPVQQQNPNHAVNTQYNNQMQQKMQNLGQMRNMNENYMNQPVHQQMNNNGTMADAMGQWMNNGQQQNNPYGALLTETQAKQQLMQQQGIPTTQPMQAQYPQQAPVQLNEHLLNAATELLNENFGHLFADTMKNTIVETYTAERVNNALKENREFIKGIVVEVIKELQNRKK